MALHHQHRIALGMTVFLWACFASAVQPLTESDMDNVSVETGQNILDIFGAAAAGLEDDIDPNEGAEESKDTASKDAAQFALQDNEQDASESTNAVSPSYTSFEDAQAAIEANAKTIGTANVFKTSSEIQYNDKDFSHKADFLRDGSVVHTRDLKIDLLKLENLRGDYNDSERSAGSIYLSNWESRGSTRMQVKD